MSPTRFRGVGPAAITPMHADGSIDWAGFADHIEFLISEGVHFLVPSGTTGESATMSSAEQLRVIEKTVEIARGRVPVMAGAGANETREACERARAAAKAGANGILSVTPYYNKPTQEGLYRHYMKQADAAGIPLFVYTVPGRTSVNCLPETLFRLAEAHEMIAGVKEASGNMEQVMAILRERPEGFTVLSGEDNLTFPMMALGAEGVISVAANEIPGPMAELCNLVFNDDYDSARTLHYKLLPIMQTNFIETNPIPVKTALEWMGHGKAYFRLPLCELSEKSAPKLRAALEESGVELGGGKKSVKKDNKQDQKKDKKKDKKKDRKKAGGDGAKAKASENGKHGKKAKALAGARR
jgi:4-hydroxy-tetrahydrodipicolinate synthase